MTGYNLKNMTKTMRLSHVEQEFIDQAAEVLTGIELEMSAPVDLYRRSRDVTGWYKGTDGPYVELRSERPTPLKVQPQRLRELRKWTSEVDFRHRVSREMSFHVHINNTPRVGPSVPRRQLVQAYLPVRPVARRLLADPARVRSHWCQSIPESSLAAGSIYHTKAAELNLDASFGTTELRLWDASLDTDLHRDRMKFLQLWIASALQNVAVSTSA